MINWLLRPVWREIEDGIRSLNDRPYVSVKTSSLSAAVAMATLGMMVLAVPNDDGTYTYHV